MAVCYHNIGRPIQMGQKELTVYDGFKLKKPFCLHGLHKIISALVEALKYFI